jgi:hypothetical protein
VKESTKTLELKFERTIVAPPGEVFDGWLNPELPGNPWHEAEKHILDPKVDGLFFLAHQRDCPLWAIYRVKPTESNSAYLDVTEYLGRGNDSYIDV